MRRRRVTVNQIQNLTTIRVSSAVLKSSSTSLKEEKKKTNCTSESLATLLVTLQPLQTLNSFDVLVRLRDTEVLAPTVWVDSHPIPAPTLITLHHYSLMIPTHLAYPILLPPSPSDHCVDLPPPHPIFPSLPLTFHPPSSLHTLLPSTPTPPVSILPHF